MAERYVSEVIRWVPGADQRNRVEDDLRARMQSGVGPDQLAAQYGPPQKLAEAYTSTIPLESAPFFRRVIAALIDIPSVMVSGFLAFYTAWKVFSTGDESFIAAILTRNPVAIALCFITLVMMSPLYYVIAESTTSQTIGKYVMGLRVVRESGTKISWKQALVRQLPLFFSFYVFDAAFALFTEKKQRLFELLSKTRVVRAR